jgi:glutamyl-tRNA reductase
MAQELFVLGLSWRTARVDVRERLAFPDDAVPDALAQLRASPHVGEAMILSTCNRVEIYGATPAAASSSVASATGEARRFFAASRGASREELEAALFEHTAADAVAHVFRVASALDSMVVGEAQILGQLKGAFSAAERCGATGPILRRCMQRAFGVAKRVRTDTGIARGAASVSSVAVELAARVFGDLAGKTVLVVGAGKMSDLAARHLRSAGAGSLLVTNRSPERAREVAAAVDGVARPWEELESALALADVVISSTGSEQPILTRALVARAMKRRRHKPQIICDIAVPRDAEAAVGEVDGVYLFDVDDMQRVVADNLRERAREAEAAELIVGREVSEFVRWLDSQAVVPTIRALRERFAAVAREEADKAIAALADKSPEQREQAIRRLADVIASKLLHPPMVALKQGEDADALAAAARRLFDLEAAAADAGDEAAADAAPAADESPAPAKTRGGP